MTTQAKSECPTCGKLIGLSGMKKHEATHDPEYIAAKEAREAESLLAVRPYTVIKTMRREGWYFCDSCMHGFESAEEPERCGNCGSTKEVMV